MNLARAFTLFRRWVIIAAITWAVLVLFGIYGFHALDMLLLSAAWFAGSVAVGHHAWSAGYRAGRDEKR